MLFNPQAILSMLKGFGIDLAPLLAKIKTKVDDGTIEKSMETVLNAAETLQRIETKLDSLLEQKQNGESGK